MNIYYNTGNGSLSKTIINKALTRLAALLKEKNKHVELVAAGGVISVVLFGSRQMTRDIDVIMPPKDKALLVKLIEQVAQEQNLPAGDHAWLNDGVSFFGLKTKSSNRVFHHPNLVVYSASWYELLGMKLSGAWRRDADFDDAIHILKAIGHSNKDEVLKESIKYKNFSPHIEDETYIKRFNRTWKDAFGK
ncbi:hypothetical protein MNBD_GAMMA09-2728 [hydrothermal vent metagenome]|uniref:Uncharacterized protein n=1 Tax=hydrothermal vent metagenome TaxID=652676 RepID=A0A3B0XSP9_9ZZZZ